MTAHPPPLLTLYAGPSTTPQDWVAADFRGEANAHKWHLVLSEADVEEVVAAAQAVEARGLKVEVSEAGRGTERLPVFLNCCGCMLAAAGVEGPQLEDELGGCGQHR